MAAIAAPRPQPPKRNCCVVDMPGVTGRIQLVGLCVGSSPSHSGAATENNLGGDRAVPCHIGADLGFRAVSSAVTPPDGSTATPLAVTHEPGTSAPPPRHHAPREIGRELARQKLVPYV